MPSAKATSKPVREPPAPQALKRIFGLASGLNALLSASVSLLALFLLSTPENALAANHAPLLQAMLLAGAAGVVLSLTGYAFFLKLGLRPSQQLEATLSSLKGGGLAPELTAEIHDEELRMLAEAAPVIFWLAKPDGEMIYISPQLTEFNGIASTSLLGDAWFAVLHPADQARVHSRWKASVRSGTPYECELRIWEAKSQTYRWILSRAIPIRNAHGEIERWFGTSTDIHASKMTQQALQESEALYRTLIASLVEGVVITDAQERYQALNASAERILGMSAETLLQQRDLPEGWKRVRPDGSPLSFDERPDLIALRTGLPQVNVLIGLDSPQRERRWISYNAQPIFRDDGDKPLGVVTSLFDMTEHFQTEARLKQSLEELERANECLRNLDRYKDEFLGTVSHELRGPLSLITGFAGLLNEGVEGSLTESQRESVWGILDAGESLTALVDDLLDMSAIQAGKLRLHPHAFHFPDLLESVVCKHAILAEARQQSLTWEAPADLPAVRADSQRIRQVLINLLGNALKYTPDGGSIRVRAMQDAEVLRCEVADSGIGISLDKQDEIFNRFSQLALDSFQAYRGTGLGLSIAKALIEAHQGEIGVSSHPGEGSVFWFTLPLAAPMKPLSEG